MCTHPTQRLRWWQRIRRTKFRDDDRGAVSVELVIAIPTLLLLILLIAQFAIWAHASHIAQTAASQALSATRVTNGSISAGTAAAQDILRQLGNGPLHNTHASVTRNSEQSTVDVEGEATSIISFLNFTVRARVVGPNERFVLPGAPR